MREISKIQKLANSQDVNVEQKKAERHGLLKSCKLQDIKLPLKQGSMDDIQNPGAGGATQTSEMEGTQQSTSTDPDSQVGTDRITKYCSLIG